MNNTGPEGALAPNPPPPPTPEGPIDHRRQLLIRAGLRDAAGNVSPEYNESCIIFNAVATPSPADGELTIDSARFQAIMRQRQPEWSARASNASFLAADVDGSTLLNRHEFAMLRRALETFDPARDGANNDLIELRCRALFATHASTLNELNAADRRALVRDLCGRSSHVDRVLAMLGWPQNNNAGTMSYAQFWLAVQQSTLMNQGSLNIADAPVIESTPHLKVDERNVVMHQAAAGGAYSGQAGPLAVAPEMRLDPELRIEAGNDWRGALAAPRGTERFRIAQLVVENARALSNEISAQPDVDHRTWMAGDEALARLLGTKESDELVRRIGRLCEDVQRIATAQPMVVQVPAPTKVFGDIHGQLRDLLMLFSRYGFPSHRGGDIETTSYVFNGDWVDRGAHQLEVVVLLFALKTLYPARVFLVRGNHEFRSQSIGMGTHGFHHHVKHHPAFSTISDRGLGGVYERIHLTFDWLPLAARVGKVVLVLHGGIGDGTWTVDNLAAVGRPLLDENAPGVPPCASQALWSDPADSDAVMAQGVHRVNVTGLNMGHVGVGNPGFGADVTRRFCANEGLQMVIRSHQFVPEGAKFMHGGHLVTVFSARNYVDPQSHNDSALLLLAYDEQGHLLVRTKRLAHRIEEKIEKGGVYWYRDSMDGVEKQVVVVSVDESIRPPSYVIRFEGRERETEGTRLSLHPNGAVALIDEAQSLTAPPATDADDATADRMWEYIAIAKSAESDSGKTSCLTALLRREENQSLLACFRGEGKWHGHGAEAHFEGAPNWEAVIAKLESFPQHLSREYAQQFPFGFGQTVASAPAFGAAPLGGQPAVGAPTVFDAPALGTSQFFGASTRGAFGGAPSASALSMQNVYVKITSSDGEDLYCGSQLLDFKRRHVLTQIGSSIDETKGVWEIEPLRYESSSLICRIRNVAHGEYLYVGSRLLDLDRARVLTWVGDHNGDPAMIWAITPVENETQSFTVRHAQRNELLCVGADTLDEKLRTVFSCVDAFCSYVDKKIWTIRVMYQLNTFSCDKPMYQLLNPFAHDKPHNPQARKPVNAVLKVVVDGNPSHFVNGFYVRDEEPPLNWVGEQNTAGQGDAAGKVLERDSYVKINDDGTKYMTSFRGFKDEETQVRICWGDPGARANLLGNHWLIEAPWSFMVHKTSTDMTPPTEGWIGNPYPPYGCHGSLRIQYL